MKINKSAINSNLPINDDENASWDSGAAIKNVKAWASDSDGNIDFDKYRKAFFWVDPEQADKQGGYKLPFADVFDGDLKAVWHGVSAAMGALLGSQGGVDLPDADRKPVYNAISKYYDKFGKDVPEFKSADFEEVHLKAFYDPKTKTAIASTDSVDRMGEVIDQAGWDLGNFKNNPVLLWAHDDRLPRIGLAQNLRVEKANGRSALMFEPKFNDASELARTVKQLFEEDGGTFSVGFMPLEMDGETYTKAELLEISAVNVPANQDAMMLAYRTLRQRGISQKVAKQVTGVKGAVSDAVANGDQTWDKYDKMDDVFDVFYAFCDVYFAPQSKLGDFSDLLNECIELLQSIADGTYTEPSMDDVVENSIMAKVLDRRANRSKDKGNQAKVPGTAPTRKSLEERQAMAKIIAKAADILAKDEKLPAENRKSVINVLNKASDKLASNLKGDLKNG